MINCVSVASSGSPAGFSRPRLDAAALRFSKLSPAPSSEIATTISLPSCASDTVIWPIGFCRRPFAPRHFSGHGRYAVAQQVLERSGHLVEHRAVDFRLAVADVEVGLLAWGPSPPGVPRDAAAGDARRAPCARPTARQDSSRLIRACAATAALAGRGCATGSAVRWRRRLTLSAIIRVTSRKREAVELSGSKSTPCSAGQRPAATASGTPWLFHLAQLIAQADHVRSGRAAKTSARATRLRRDRARWRDFADFPADQLVHQAGPHPQLDPPAWPNGAGGPVRAAR